jgi:cytochrome c-type biogenesis protein CcmH
VVVVLVLLRLATPLFAAAPADLDREVRTLATQLRCPVCQNLSVADSSSELARDMRAVIRAELAAGRTPEEIKAYFVSKYGDWILLSPRPRGLTWLLWIGPFAGAALGGLVAIRMARRWARRARSRERLRADPVLVERVRREVLREDENPVSPSGDPTPLALERNNLYAALRELDFDHQSGKLSDADYEAMRDDYEARAVAVLAELPQAPPRATAPRAPTSRSDLPAGRRRPWRLVAASAFLLVFGVSVGYFLSQSVRPRASDRESITGDALTGTGPARATVGDLRGLMASGRAAYERQEWRAAIEAFKQALVLAPEDPEAHTFVGLILLHAGHGDDALRAIDRALATAPRHPLALWAKGLALFDDRQDYRGAIRVWESLMTLDLAAEDADRVAGMITEARRRLAAPPAEPRPSPRPARASPGP